MSGAVEVEPQGDHESVVRLPGDGAADEEAGDLPDVVELEDVAASHDGHLDAVRPAARP
ncbi:hypothetical protein [Geodermatophilus dictyosporus]|nr:hypothetical protein [Geodermatophilus dictyosporus]